MEHTHVLSQKSPLALPFEARGWISVAHREDLDVLSQKTGETISEGESREMVTLVVGWVVEVSLSTASFLLQAKSYLHFPVPFPEA